ncbi:hypothetical protein KU306_15215 [Haloferax larsenii]|uniref:Secreted protein n=1 Tax=Haloferax larsenii TaxID=302484 RepID=A0ABY5RD08_HALLR|nr:hypothetical protein [Haloferax larsenii]ELZ78495.1 hypothetical protein C455_12448 [Haloferax larsenii JCM 13917]UVE50232.1 hypothetical protein KU306_15215 [Haloferax larsenii]
MNRHAIIGVVLAVLLSTAGVAAATPGNAPVEPNADESGVAGAQGPPSELPGPVPDFVSDIHSAITDFLNGMLDGALGPVVSDATEDTVSETGDA